MTGRAVETSPQLYARIGGWVYLVVIVTALFSEIFVRGKLIASGDAEATAQNIMASESLWRMGFASDLMADVCYVAVTLILYVLLRPVNRNLALLAAFFSLVGCAIGSMSALAHFGPVLILGGADYLKTFDPHQLQSLALLSLKFHLYGNLVSLVFFGFYCISLGYLIFRAGYFPKFLGVLLAIGGLGYLTNSFVHFLSSTQSAAISGGLLLAPGGIAEILFCFWLIVMGVNVSKWEAKATQLSYP